MKLPADDKPVVLLVESDVLQRTAVAAYLRECGYRVIETASADEAVCVLGSELRVDVAFVELEATSSKQGFDLVRWIRTEQPGIKIILASGVQRTAKQAESLCESGPLLAKPYDYRILERHLRRLLGRSAVKNGW